MQVMHDLQLVHTDLKPENILLVSSDYISENRDSLTNCMEWGYPCDIWSIGCILVKLCSGEALFQTHENLEHMAMMEGISRHAEKNIRRGRLNWPEGASTSESIRAVQKLTRLQNVVMQHVDHSAGDLFDLLGRLLKYDPATRWTAREALGHPFVTNSADRRFW
ncbi:hypothetical protein ZIOFF_050774 [Zingiber officinale]|uniref:Protein kinase domain-containing protein n=1 Tax=Zingiber officinale TaxID=94328 RepID=A0A8J5FLN4_ZINOF|nr:hypothetical protein ZIOFF_050774 [Zingiber officinale]